MNRDVTKMVPYPVHPKRLDNRRFLGDDEDAEDLNPYCFTEPHHLKPGFRGLGPRFNHCLVFSFGHKHSR